MVHCVSRIIVSMSIVISLFVFVPASAFVFVCILLLHVYLYLYLYLRLCLSLPVSIYDNAYRACMCVLYVDLCGRVAAYVRVCLS